MTRQEIREDSFNMTGLSHCHQRFVRARACVRARAHHVGVKDIMIGDILRLHSTF